MQQSIIKYNDEIFGKKTKEIINEDEVLKNFKMKNTSLKKSSKNKSKNEELEMSEPKNIDKIIEDLSDEAIDELDVDSLRSFLKKKSKIVKNLNEEIQVLNHKITNLLNKENEKKCELETLVKLQTTEFQRNKKFVTDLKKEINFWREKANINAKNNKTLDQISEANDNKFIDNMCSGDLDILFSSEMENVDLSKKWFSDEEKIEFHLEHLEIKLGKIDLTEKINFIQMKELKFIDFEIHNLSESSLLFNDLQIESTESKIIL